MNVPSTRSSYIPLVDDENMMTQKMIELFKEKKKNDENISGIKSDPSKLKMKNNLVLKF